MKILNFALISGCAILLASCAVPTVKAEFDPVRKEASRGIVYSFASASEKKVFTELMHPAGSSAPEAFETKKGINIAFWTRPGGETPEKVFALWSTGKKPSVAYLKTEGSISGFYNERGERQRLLLSGNKTRVELSGKLLYIVGSPGLRIEIPEK